MKYSDRVPDPTPQDVPQRDVALRALLLGERMSQAVTHLAAQVLGHDATGNRAVQVLLTVHGAPGSTPGDLSAMTGISGPALSRCLAQLSGEGLIARRASTTDARSARIRLTSKGGARIRAFDAALVTWVDGELPTVKEIVDLLGLPEPIRATDIGGLELVAMLGQGGEAYLEEVGPVLLPVGVHDLSARHTLTLLLDRNRMRPSTMAAELNLSTSGVSDLLTRLEGSGVVRRDHGDPTDRRAVLVSLTPRGEAVAEAKLEVFARHARDLMLPLTVALHPRKKERR